MLLAVTEDVQRRLGRPLSADEAGRAEGLLEEASLIVTRLLRRDFESEFPPPEVVLVVSRMVARSLQRPNELVGAESWQEQWGPFMGSLRFGRHANDAGVWLTAQDRELLGVGGSSGIAVPLRSARFS